MSTKRFFRRRFLNLRGFHAGAYVLATCEVEALQRSPAASQWVEAEISIADCGRVVTLDFRAHNEPAARNSLYKARLLRDVLVEFTAALETAVDELRSVQK